MQVIRAISTMPTSACANVLALGNFDGLHRGHIAVLQQAKQLAQQQNVPLAVMSFEPHPRRFFNPTLPSLRLMPLAQKLRYLRDFGVDNLFLMRFNAEFSHVTAAEFVDNLLIKQLAITGLVTGEKFIFGHNRGGNTAFLQQRAQQHGFTYHPISREMLGAAACSSTRIREAISLGDMEQAARILGRPYALSGRIIHGDQRGRTLGYPTANLRPGPLFFPALGVYVVRMTLDGVSYPGVANFGVRPMYQLLSPLLETYLFDQNIDLYGRDVSVELLHYLRGEGQFADETNLITQMQHDEAQARLWLQNNPHNETTSVEKECSIAQK